MFGLSILFLLLAIVAGVFGFFGLAGTLTSLAVIAFYIFVALLIVSLIAQAFGDAGSRGGAVGAIVVVALVAGGLYFWSKDHGGSFNKDVRAATADASDVIKKTDEKAKEVVGDVSRSTRTAIDQHKADGQDH